MPRDRGGRGGIREAEGARCAGGWRQLGVRARSLARHAGQEPSDDENDMLDLAFGLTPTSRLGCQVVAAPELDGLRVRLPSATRNMAVDGFVPKPH